VLKIPSEVLFCLIIAAKIFLYFLPPFKSSGAEKGIFRVYRGLHLETKKNVHVSMCVGVSGFGMSLHSAISILT